MRFDKETSKMSALLTVQRERIRNMVRRNIDAVPSIAKIQETARWNRVPRFAANLSMMFTEVPFLDRFAAAGSAGFSAVEFLSPYEYPCETIAQCAKASGVVVSLFNLPAGDWSAGERGISCIPGREAEFRAGVDTALSYAKCIGNRHLHAMAGIVPPGADIQVCRRTLIENLKYAAGKFAEHEITLLLEAINTRDVPGFLVSTQADCYSICQEVGLKNLKMQMDFYHMQVMEGDLATKLKKYAPACAHIQISGCPERAEPDTGEISYPYLYRLIDDLGYTGWVGCEYRPSAKTIDGLGWFQTAMSTKHSTIN
jgi:2-dehydrotetronate isomerase